MAIRQFSPRRAIRQLIALAPEREIFLRSGGRVRFLRISTRAQFIAAGLALTFLLLWAVGGLALLWSQTGIALERANLVRHQRSVNQREAQVKAYRRSVSDIAKDIEARQNALDQLVNSSFGPKPDGSALVGPAQGDAAPGDGSTNAKTGKNDKTTANAASPEATRLNQVRARQMAFEAQLTTAARRRLARVEKAIRSFGLNPAKLAKMSTAQGGPFVPLSGPVATQPDLRDLATLLSQLNQFELTLAAIPSGRPTDAPMESSSYGYRRDPFNGRLAFHAGIDFPGRLGQPVLAAAPGRISFVGQRHGYGNVVEINHGHGLMTRYAHLSGFNAHVGERVTRGEQIARMGSTGRSTGTHLHFEVRVHGNPVNPQPFLEARQDVLKVQQLAKQRAVGSSRG